MVEGSEGGRRLPEGVYCSHGCLSAADSQVDIQDLVLSLGNTVASESLSDILPPSSEIMSVIVSGFHLPPLDSGHGPAIAYAA